MSTRAQIVVEKNEKVKFYKHSDGYPSGVLPVLRDLLPLFAKHRGFDPEYLTAHIVAAYIKDGEEGRREYILSMAQAHPEDKYFTDRLKRIDTPSFTVYGLDTVWHGDIEYAYRVTKTFAVEIYKTPWDMKDTGQAKLLASIPLEDLANLTDEAILAYNKL